MRKMILLMFVVSACSVSPAPETTTTTVAPSTKIEISSRQSEGVAYYIASVQIEQDASMGTLVQSGLTSDVARSAGVDFAVNGDFFNYRNDGVVVRGGQLIRDEPRREGMALTMSGEMVVYTESPETSKYLAAIGAVEAFSFGPILMNGGLVQKDLSEYYEVDAGRSINGRHPRTGMCMVRQNHFIFVVVDGRSPGYSRGVTLEEFANIFLSLGCVVAYNLDGGGSSVMYYDNNVVNNPLGKGRERNNGDLIYVTRG